MNTEDIFEVKCEITGKVFHIKRKDIVVETGCSGYAYGDTVTIYSVECPENTCAMYPHIICLGEKRIPSIYNPNRLTGIYTRESVEGFFKWYNGKENKMNPKIETLSDTTDLMESKDYKDRFKAEYYQLKIRLEKLHLLTTEMEAGWDKKGDRFLYLEYTPDSDYDTLKTQEDAMTEYLHALERRSVMEGIKL